MKVALLSNVTVDLLAGMLKKEHDIHLSAGFDTWQQEMIIPTSSLYDYKPEAVVVLLHADAFSWEGRGTQIIDEWCGAFSAFTANMPGVPLFVSSIAVFSSSCFWASVNSRARVTL